MVAKKFSGFQATSSVSIICRDKPFFQNGHRCLFRVGSVACARTLLKGKFSKLYVILSLT